jgi:drug/metabolite transporter (DMT)-like permease
VTLVGWSPLEPGVPTIQAVAAGQGAPLSYAVAGNVVRARLADVAPLELATGMVTAGAIVALPVAVLSGPPGSPAVDGVVSLVAVGVLSTAVAWPIFFRVLRRTTPTAASTVTFIVPAFAIAWGSIVLAEPVGIGLVVGFGLILLSLMLVLGIQPSVRMPWAARPQAAAAHEVTS